MSLKQTIKNVRRTREIIRILFKYGFEDLVVNTPLQRLIPLKRRESWLRKERSIFEYTRWERVRMATEELGATFIKGAQVLSNRPDLLPDEMLEQFQRLQSNVEPFPFSVAKEIVERELGKPLEEVYEYFEEKTLGSASIGQVHKARLIDGTDVVVKVQRPEVKERVDTDLEIFKSLARQGAELLERNGITNVMDVIEAFEKSMQKEMDYTVEARNIQQFRNYYKDYDGFYVPRAYKEFSTVKVLTLEFVTGCKMTDIEQLKEWNISPADLAERGLTIYLTQIFEHGFFHADPHPGNIIVSKTGVINLIDFGMVGKLAKRDKQAFAWVMISMAQQDSRRMAEYLLKLATENSVKNIRDLEADLNELIEDFAYLDVSESSFADLAQRLQAVIYKYKMRVPGGVFIILRALAILEGIGKTIHPSFNTYEFMKPYGRKLVMEEFSPKNVAYKLFTLGNNMASLAGTLPTDIKDIVEKLRKGVIRFEIAPKDYEPFVRRLDMMLNRLMLTLIIVALIIASSIIIAAHYIHSPDSNNIPMIAIIGLVIAALFFLLLWRAMGKTNKDRFKVE